MVYGIIRSIHTDVEDVANGGTLVVPVFSSEAVPEYYCSRYVRLTSEHLFGKKFPNANAWRMREECRVVSRVDGNEDLICLIERGVLKPGMAVGLKYFDSTYKDVSCGYTHLVLYLGKGGNVPFFADQFIEDTRVSVIADWSRFGAKEILAACD